MEFPCGSIKETSFPSSALQGPARPPWSICSGASTTRPPENFARAMVNRPEILLADEPTGNLNEHLTLIMVTHNQELAHHAERLFEMKDGLIYEITDSKKGGG